MTSFSSLFSCVPSFHFCVLIVVVVFGSWLWRDWFVSCLGEGRGCFCCRLLSFFVLRLSLSFFEVCFITGVRINYYFYVWCFLLVCVYVCLSVRLNRFAFRRMFSRNRCCCVVFELFPGGSGTSDETTLVSSRRFQEWYSFRNNHMMSFKPASSTRTLPPP